MSGYRDGVRIEHLVIHDLRANGYETTRGASSKGSADVIAIKPGQVLLISCKRTTPPGPTERAELLRIAAMLPGVGVALVALKPLREPLRYRRLVGLRPRDWVVWTPDLVQAARDVTRVGAARSEVAPITHGASHSREAL